MIKGNEFAKLFSEVEEQEVNEKLFSTGDEELDELLEKVYSAGIEDGYEYAQREEFRQVNFSNLDEKMIAHLAKDEKGLADMKKQYKNALKNKELSDKDRKQLEGLLNTVEAVEKDPDSFVKLNFGDRLGSAEYKLYKKGGRAEKAERERLSGSSKNLLIAGGVGSAIGAAGVGAYAAHKVHNLPMIQRKTTPAKAGLKVGLISGSAAAASAGLTIAADKVLAKNSPKYKKNMEKQKDLLDYRMGNLSKKDFVKKWGGKINGKEIEGSENKKKES